MKYAQVDEVDIARIAYEFDDLDRDAVYSPYLLQESRPIVDALARELAKIRVAFKPFLDVL